jgi:hypothetical protein
MESVPWNDRPTVWVVSVVENGELMRRVALSQDGVYGFLWKRKFSWIDEWNLDRTTHIHIPDDVGGLFAAVESIHSILDSIDGVVDLGTWGPVVDGFDTGFSVHVHVSFNRLYP